VKKVQRSFAIEYKSGRRKADPKSNSIWGNMDLKSVARDVQEETMPFLPAEPQDNKSFPDMLSSQADPTGPSLTPSAGHHETAVAAQEAIIVDESDRMANAVTPAIVATPAAPKKQRKPRPKKVVAEPASSDVAAEPAAAPGATVVKQRRGRKPNSVEDADSPRRTPLKRGPKTVQISAVTPLAIIDEMADLLQLEAENQELRKLLADKLRAENAGLRKRLKTA
jgi:hypothetical protein